jgi:hypothetical protein
LNWNKGRDSSNTSLTVLKKPKKNLFKGFNLKIARNRMKKQRKSRFGEKIPP